MHVFVLESLKTKDPKTGKAIHKFLGRENISSEYHQFTSITQLFDTLKHIETECLTKGLKPFVHFDCHGNGDGIAVITNGVNGELVQWAEILDQFIAIYRASNQGLVVCMSSCNGFHISRMVAMGKACPFDQLSGSLKKIPFGKSLQAYRLFYKRVFEGIPVFDAAVEIHHTAELSDVQFISANRATLWDLTYKGYVRDKLTPTALAAEKAELLAILYREFPNPSATQLNYIDQATSLNGKMQILADYQQTFLS
jgi:hypothetical protein